MAYLYVKFQVILINYTFTSTLVKIRHRGHINYVKFQRKVKQINIVYRH